MKKLLVLVLVLAMTQVSWGAFARIVNPQNDYLPSANITIQVVEDTFDVGQFGINYVNTDNGGTASAPALNARLTEIAPVNAGTVVNAGGILLQAVIGSVDYFGTIGGDLAAGTVLYTFTYHVPDVPYSTMINITFAGVSIADSFYTNSTDAITGVGIHVIPEPMTMGLLGLGGLFLRRRSK